MPGPQLLVSVRDATEAIAALTGGADLIDIKEPSRGPLGRADATTIAAVVQAVGGRVPVSAALGELREWALFRGADELSGGVRYVKWGLSGLESHWRHQLHIARMIGRLQELVAVAYADWVFAEAPRPADVVAFAVADQPLQAPVVLFDTFQKSGMTLLDWLSIEEVTTLVKTCHGAGVKVALAGSLTYLEIERLRDVRPDWFAVRGAACDGGRDGTISEKRVRQLADLVHSLYGGPEA
jgi:uncharacterized protein (UPF0264 family)